ncbi:MULTISPECIES: DinB family protein [unclassified Allomuricauda]|uniref:DinB family protein n=1 Tax=unclassified Allomuricauda TaxID=2615049 RepID=UPI00273F49DB|nr:MULTISPECIES: DinB family protein [unclassified Allomuricauda]
MTKHILKDLLDQNIKTCSYTLKEIDQKNSTLRLNDDTASVGFIYRHIGEIMHLTSQFFGIPTSVQNTTMGEQDTGKTYHWEESKKLVEDGYQILKDLVENLSEEEWMETIETPFFGPISRIKLFGHILYHNSYHCGQITLALKRGK